MPTNKKLLVAGLIVIGVAICFTALVWSLIERDDAIAKRRIEAIQHHNTSPEAPPEDVTAEQLIADYRANEAAADSKYKDKHLSVSGTVGRITNEFLTLEVKDSITDVQCIYKDGVSGPINLLRGQHTTVVGFGGGKLSNVIVLDCRP